MSEAIPPIIVDEQGDLQAFESLGEAATYVEAIDVLNNEYLFYDSTGRILEARVYRENVSLLPTTRMAESLEDLRKRIARILQAVGHRQEDLLELPVNRLAQLLLEEDKKARATSFWGHLRDTFLSFFRRKHED